MAPPFPPLALSITDCNTLLAMGYLLVKKYAQKTLHGFDTSKWKLLHDPLQVIMLTVLFIQFCTVFLFNNPISFGWSTSLSNQPFLQHLDLY